MPRVPALNLSNHRESRMRLKASLAPAKAAPSSQKKEAACRGGLLTIASGVN